MSALMFDVAGIAQGLRGIKESISTLKRSAEEKIGRGVDKNVYGVAMFCF